jgi:hypothetical protein
MVTARMVLRVAAAVPRGNAVPHRMRAGTAPTLEPRVTVADAHRDDPPGVGPPPRHAVAAATTPVPAASDARRVAPAANRAGPPGASR